MEIRINPSSELKMWKTVRAQTDALAKKNLAVNSTLKHAHGLPRKGKNNHQALKAELSHQGFNQSRTSLGSLPSEIGEEPRYKFPGGDPAKAFKVKCLRAFQAHAAETDPRMTPGIREKRLKLGSLFGALREIDKQIEEEKVRKWVALQGLDLDSHALTAAMTLSEFLEAVYLLCPEKVAQETRGAETAQNLFGVPEDKLGPFRSSTSLGRVNTAGLGFPQDSLCRQSSKDQQSLWSSRKSLNVKINTGKRRNMIKSVSAPHLHSRPNQTSVATSFASGTIILPSVDKEGSTSLKSNPSAASPYHTYMKWQDNAASLVDLSVHRDPPPPHLNPGPNSKSLVRTITGSPRISGLHESDYTPGTVEWLRNRNPTAFVETAKEMARHRRYMDPFEDKNKQGNLSSHDRLHQESLQKSQVFNSAWPGQISSQHSLVDLRRSHERKVETLKKYNANVAVALATNASRLARDMDKVKFHRGVQKKLLSRKKIVKRHRASREHRKERVDQLKEVTAKRKLEGRKEHLQHIDRALEQIELEDKQWEASMRAKRQPLPWDPAKSSLILPDLELQRRKQEAKGYEEWRDLDREEKLREDRLRDERIRALATKSFSSTAKPKRELSPSRALLDPGFDLDDACAENQLAPSPHRCESPWARRPISPLLGFGSERSSRPLVLPTAFGRNMRVDMDRANSPSLDLSRISTPDMLPSPLERKRLNVSEVSSLLLSPQLQEDFFHEGSSKYSSQLDAPQHQEDFFHEDSKFSNSLDDTTNCTKGTKKTHYTRIPSTTRCSTDGVVGEESLSIAESSINPLSVESQSANATTVKSQPISLESPTHTFSSTFSSHEFRD